LGGPAGGNRAGAAAGRRSPRWLSGGGSAAGGRRGCGDFAVVAPAVEHGAVCSSGSRQTSATAAAAEVWRLPLPPSKRRSRRRKRQRRQPEVHPSLTLPALGGRFVRQSSVRTRAGRRRGGRRRRRGGGRRGGRRRLDPQDAAGVVGFAADGQLAVAQ